MESPSTFREDEEGRLVYVQDAELTHKPDFRKRIEYPCTDEILIP